MKKVAAFIALLLLGTAGTIGWKIYTSPEYSLRIVQKAVQQHDVTTFEKHVDIEGSTRPTERTRGTEDAR